jgi:tetratricopeptide (TPR) repeat protein
MVLTPDPADAQALARRLAQGDASVAPLPADAAARLALAWALKHQCYEALNTAPGQAVAAAAALHRLCQPGADHAAEREILALARWTEGAARITQGRMADAVDSLMQAEAGFRSLGQAASAAQTQVPCIIALGMLGRLDEAAAVALRVQREFVGQGDRQAAGKVSLNLGNLQMRREACGDAVHHYREAAVLFARVRDHAHSVMADIGLADALTAIGDFSEALRIYARARMRADQHKLPVAQALVDESVALLHLARGHYRDALAGMEAARRRYELLDMPQHLAIAEKQLADTYLALRLLPEARALYEAVQARFEALAMPYEQAWTLAQTGRACALQGEMDLADELLAQSARMFQAQDNPVGAADILLTRAECLLRCDDPASALTLAGQAAQAFATAERPDARARAELARAQALLGLGQLDKAAQSFDLLLLQARSRLGPTLQVRCLTGLGRVALERGETSAAEQAFEAAVHLSDDQRRALPGDELRNAFLGDHLQAHEGLLRIALDRHAAQASPAGALAVLIQLDRVRARTLGDRLGQPMQPLVDPDDERLRTRLHWLYRRTQGMDNDAPPTAALLAERQRTEDALLERARRRRLAATLQHLGDDGLPQRSQGEADAHCAALPARLAPGEALVVYGVLDEELFACIVSGQGTQVHRSLARWPDVLAALRALKFQIDAPRHGGAVLQSHAALLQQRAAQRLQQLHRLIWAPLAPQLGRCHRLLVAPHGPLAAVPFAALHDGQHGLGERHEIALVASARMALHGLDRPACPPRAVLALGESSRLAWAADEAGRVAAHYPEGIVRVGAEASLASLQTAAPGADVIHLACHGLFRSDNPMFSALHLADGALTVEQAEGLRLKPATVVLSACETGLAGLNAADEGFGLVRAFLVAGAARVVASLWPVDDAVTAIFMARFHAALSGGHTPARALQAAQQAVAAQHPHPFHWAAFALHGGW